ncbi:AAA family ATPase [Clostridium sp. 2-1]|uniref:AAA family ATPase n=1 Tax=Clostridium TaxID=1485 RepID=UPI000CDB9330|nr:AAA family ATPase [Clostridium sp. 2-1]MBN7573081.1 AAA family ATPase [Clostridium beijerinckii]MBN7578420.1 AAA family ATPase [Clostridium beijerinckii]MBN7582855.1 AAA family ATPase [Clostridium beijerinckii]MBO0519020.1 AAA family ATPase [Clostridium beijerinckii]POO93285.1 AAA family ATPase [Clostridium sp. 2-1]
MRKTIQIGTSDFKKLIEGKNYFVDKSLLIKEFIENSADIILTPRPRRFGKTLNLSMLRYFFDIRTKNETKDLFKDLKIENEKEIMKLQGEYPVIFITFKNQKHLSYDDFKIGIQMLLSNLYKEHEYLLESNNLSEFDKADFKEIISRKAPVGIFSEAISNLMMYMNKHYGKKVMLFIDEYDVPIQEAYLDKGNPTHIRSLGTFEEPNARFGLSQHDNMIALIRNLLTSALKDNPYVEKSLITGILRVVKESIFSGLNNLEVNTLLRKTFNDKFGFTKNEIRELLSYYKCEDDMQNIKKWYNGYIFGGEVIYNPWSVLNYLKNTREGFMPYWINSSSNDLIKRLLLKGDNNIKLELEELIEGNSINKKIDDSIVMAEVEDSNENIWSFLLMSGYLKAVKTENIEGILNCELKIPNKEVLIFYRNLIEKWFKEALTNQKYELMLNTLITGNIKIFAGLFKEFVINNLSYFDISGKEPERVYNAFVLGMLVSLSNEYEVKSNKESGYGRYDVMIIPKDISKIGIIIEFKKIDYFLDDTIEEATKEALRQIEEKNYAQELFQKEVKNIIKLAIVFKGKEVRVTQGENLDY